jgi:hypothetical protein
MEAGISNIKYSVKATWIITADNATGFIKCFMDGGWRKTIGEATTAYIYKIQSNKRPIKRIEDVYVIRSYQKLVDGKTEFVSERVERKDTNLNVKKIFKESNILL